MEPIFFDEEGYELSILPVYSDSDSPRSPEEPKRRPSDSKQGAKVPLLKQRPVPETKKAITLDKPEQILMHKVQRGDTLEGLELQYEVSKFAIMQRNGLSSGDIYWMKEIIIPNPSKPAFWQI